MPNILFAPHSAKLLFQNKKIKKANYEKYDERYVKCIAICPRVSIISKNKRFFCVPMLPFAGKILLSNQFIKCFSSVIHAHNLFGKYLMFFFRFVLVSATAFVRRVQSQLFHQNAHQNTNRTNQRDELIFDV